MKESIKKLETTIGGLFKDAPPLPKNAKKTLVDIWPWLALIFGVLQLVAAWGLWRLFSWADRVQDAFTAFYVPTVYTYSAFDKLVIYLAIAVLLVDAVILLMAYPELKKRARRGWDLLFLGSLINLAYAVVSVFIRDRGISSLIFGLLSSAISFYLLFQVRDMYGAKQTKESKTAKTATK